MDKDKNYIEQELFEQDYYGINLILSVLDYRPLKTRRTLDKYNKIDFNKDEIICSFRCEKCAPDLREPFEVDYKAIYKDKKGNLWLRCEKMDFVCWNYNYGDKDRLTRRIKNTPENIIKIEKIKVLMEKLKETDNGKD